MPEGDTSLHRCRTLRTFLEARSEAGSGERSEDLTWRVISIRCVFTGAFDVSGSGGGDFGSRERLSLPGLSDSAPHGHGSGQSSPWFVRRALRAHLVRYCSGGSSGGGSGERFSWALELKGKHILLRLRHISSGQRANIELEQRTNGVLVPISSVWLHADQGQRGFTPYEHPYMQNLLVLGDGSCVGMFDVSNVARFTTRTHEYWRNEVGLLRNEVGPDVLSQYGAFEAVCRGWAAAEEGKLRRQGPHHAQYGAALHSMSWQKQATLAVGGSTADRSEAFTTMADTISAEYVDAFLAGALDDPRMRRIGFGEATRSRTLVDRTLAEVAGTILTAELALAHGLACNTAGGTHHAFRDTGSGFCILNDLALAAELLLAQGRAQRVLILDLDVHQGDGTAAIFAGRGGSGGSSSGDASGGSGSSSPSSARQGEQPLGDVFTLSVHGANNFPTRKQASTLDVGLPDGTGDEQYLRVVAEVLQGVLQSFRPDLVLFDAGVDVHRDDALGRLALSDEGLRRRELLVLDSCLGAGVPVAGFVGGGYHADLEVLAARHCWLHRAATELWVDHGL